MVNLHIWHYSKLTMIKSVSQQQLVVLLVYNKVGKSLFPVDILIFSTHPPG